MEEREIEMEPITIISVLLGMVGSSFGVIMAVANYSRLKKKDGEEDVATTVSLKADLKYMAFQLGDINRKLERIEGSVSDVTTAIAENKTDIKNLYATVGKLEERIAK